MTNTPKPTEQAGDPAENVAKVEPKELTKLKTVAKELADMSEVDRGYWLEKKAVEVSLEGSKLKQAVQAELHDRAIATAKQRLRGDHAAKLRAEAEAEERRKHDREHKEMTRARQEADKREAAAKKAAEREKRKAETEAEREQRKADREAERKVKEKSKGFANMLRLPVARHEKELRRLAERLGEDLAALRQEFTEFAGVADSFSIASNAVEPWPDPINPAALLQAIDDKIRKHFILQPYKRTAVTLWVAMSWVHNEIATFSPILLVTSAEADSGKTTLLGIIARLVPKPSLNVDSTGASVFRFVDAHKPTLIIDEADDLFARKADLKHVINSSWTRGTTIPRSVKIDGIWTTVHFDPFCPKALGLIAGNLPRTLTTRSIPIHTVPRRADELVEPFEHVDDFELATLRRQQARFAADNAAVLKTAQPTIPGGMINRVEVNWKLMLAIAELAGGPWLEQAREAAQRLSRSGRQPSDGVRLLTAIRVMFIETGKTELTSEEMVAELCRNPLDLWLAYNKGGRITQRQVAALLSAYDIHPLSLHPTKRKDFSRQGYKLAQFADAFARYLPEHSIIQSSQRSKASPSQRHSTKPAKRKSARRTRSMRMPSLAK